MSNIFSYEDIVFEISKYVINTNFINFSLVNRLCYYTIDKLIDNIDEYKFLKSNNMTIINKNFSGDLNFSINLNNIPNINNFYQKYKKHKPYTVKYIIDKIFIKIYSNGYLVINNCVSLFDAYTKINDLFLLLQNLKVIRDIPIIKLVPKLSCINFDYSNELHYKHIPKTHYELANNTSYLRTYYKRYWFNNSSNNNYKINVEYKNFKDFYKFFMLHIKL